MLLSSEGYVLLRNKIPENDLLFDFTIFDSYQQKTKVDYSKLKYFIDHIYFPRISTFTPHYGKFRYSNNTNGKDAAVLHGDTYNHTDENTIPVYTCLLYFDEAEMELIPHTHKKDYVNSKSASELFNSRVKVQMKPGDILIFHSNLHHRGVGYNTILGSGGIKSRRLLQIFDVCFSESDYEKYFEKLTIVMTGNSLLVKMQNYLGGTTQGPGEFLSMMNYFLVRHDYQYRSILIDIPQCEKKGRIISYEPGKRSVYKDYCKASERGVSSAFIDDENINVICDDIAEKNSRPISNFKVYLLMLIIVLVIAYKLRK